ncbi:hypothetical protein JCGZ_08591 [Jatropha curcas]|uniref:Uncharacterized protein n=1 Tax=Jatropha curcas TaxID=180498 RepID=A0A067KJP3_JATCU|nr:hypothetical protein JCGZ_08591 [Jatropha curcas]
MLILRATRALSGPLHGGFSQCDTVTKHWLLPPSYPIRRSEAWRLNSPDPSPSALQWGRLALSRGNKIDKAVKSGSESEPYLIGEVIPTKDWIILEGNHCF